MMRRGFTLIELLVVVAIISILATIAVPNFLEAQVRSKVSRVRSDLRTLATALECYAVDNNNKYPFDANGFQQGGHITDVISTPVPYVTSQSAIKDPFRAPASDPSGQWGKYMYHNPTAHREVDLWRYCWTPDAPLAGEFPPPCPLDPIPGITEEDYFQRVSDFGMWWLASKGPGGEPPFWPNPATPGCNYDPTNGTVSSGYVFRSQKSS